MNGHLQALGGSLAHLQLQIIRRFETLLSNQTFDEPIKGRIVFEASLAGNMYAAARTAIVSERETSVDALATVTTPCRALHDDFAVANPLQTYGTSRLVEDSGKRTLDTRSFRYRSSGFPGSFVHGQTVTKVRRRFFPTRFGMIFFRLLAFVVTIVIVKLALLASFRRRRFGICPFYLLLTSR